MAEDGEDFNWIGGDDFEKFCQIFSKYTNGAVSPLKKWAIFTVRCPWGTHLELEK